MQGNGSGRENPVWTGSRRSLAGPTTLDRLLQLAGPGRIDPRQDFAVPPTPSDPHITESADSGGFNRRTMIKRAAAVGAVAWTAPVILDSMASPAAAVTCGPGACDDVSSATIKYFADGTATKNGAPYTPFG